MRKADTIFPVPTKAHDGPVSTGFSSTLPHDPLLEENLAEIGFRLATERELPDVGGTRAARGGAWAGNPPKAGQSAPLTVTDAPIAPASAFRRASATSPKRSRPSPVFSVRTISRLLGR